MPFDPCGAWRRRPPRPLFGALLSLTPIFFFKIWRILAKLKPRLTIMREAKISSSRKRPNNKCSVPILGAPRRLASSPA